MTEQNRPTERPDEIDEQLRDTGHEAAPESSTVRTPTGERQPDPAGENEDDPAAPHLDTAETLSSSPGRPPADRDDGPGMSESDRPPG